MTLEVDKLPRLTEIFSDYIVGKGIDLTAKSTLFVDEELDLEELTLDTLKSFDRLAPFGMDHKKPVFYIRDFQVESAFNWP